MRINDTLTARRASRARGAGAAIALLAAGLALGACRAPDEAGPDIAAGATPATSATGVIAIESAPTPTGPVAGTLVTAAPIQTSPEAPGTPRPTAEAAAAATQQKAAAEAAVLPRYRDHFGVPGTQPGQIMLPFDVAVDAEGNTYIGDSTGVQLFGADGKLVRRIGEGTLPMAEGLAVAPGGKLYVAGFGSQVLVFGPDGAAAGTIGETGSQPGQLLRPKDVAVDAAGNVYVADSGNARVEKFGPDGRPLLTIGERGSERGQFTSPRVVAVDAEGRIYVGSGDDFLVQRFAPDGTYLDTFGQGALDENLFRTGGIVVDDAGGRIYVSQSMGQSLQSFDLADPTRYLGAVGGHAGMMPGEFNSPGGLALRDGLIYVADTRNNRIQTFTLPEPGE